MAYRMMQAEERRVLVPTTPEQMANRYHATVYGRKFSGPTVPSVFVQIDEFEDLPENRNRRAESYIVLDLFEEGGVYE